MGLHSCFTVLFFTVTVTECKKTKMGIEYSGRINVTNTGIPCQKWISQSPHGHPLDKLHDHRYPENSSTLARNYCRNPDLEGWEGPWCYTVNPHVRWEYCHVKCCKGSNCI